MMREILRIAVGPASLDGDTSFSIVPVLDITWRIDPTSRWETEFGQPPEWCMSALGYIPGWIEWNPGTLLERLNLGYAAFGGWTPFPRGEPEAWTMDEDGLLQYGAPVADEDGPADPPYIPLAEVTLGDQTMRVYRHGWVALTFADRSIEVCRMD